MANLGVREEVYVWAGPPRISVSAEWIEYNGHKWLQHIVEGTEGGHGVVAVAEFAGKLLLVEHYRPATGTNLLEFPRGFGGAPPSGRTVQEHARAEGSRELVEETGMASSKSRFMGFIWPDSGILGNKVAVVSLIADSDREVQAKDGEIDDLRWVTPAELRGLIASGQVCDGITLAAYALWSASAH